MKFDQKSLLVIVLLLLIVSIIIVPINLEKAMNIETRNFDTVSPSISLPSSPPITILSDSDFLSYSFPGTGSVENPYRIEYLEITTLGYYGIKIENVSKSFVIQNCRISALVSAIRIFNCTSESILLKSNWCQGTGVDFGILVIGTRNNSLKVINNTCLDWDYGMDINKSPYSLIENNTLMKNLGGLRVEHDISHSLVVNNYCMNNREGMDIADSKNVTIKNNYIYNNFIGLLTDSMSYEEAFQDCIIIDNLFDNNTSYAIIITAYLEPSYPRNNHIYHNTIINNNKNGDSQAKDTGQNNLWYNESLKEGNYWSNWLGFGSYQIYGSVFSLDLYPLEHPLQPTFTNPPLMFLGRFILMISIASTVTASIIVVVALYLKKHKKRVDANSYVDNKTS